MPEKEPGVQELFDRITACEDKVIPLKGFGYRYASTKYASRADLLSGKGAAKYGGRWNPIGMRAIYLSLDPDTACQEAFQHFMDYGIKKTVAIKPHVFASAEIEVSELLDLSDSKILKKINFTLKELLAEDWKGIQQQGIESWTQAIGRGCKAAGFDGLIAPSSKNKRGQNLVLFPEHIKPPKKCTPVGPDELPPPQSEWTF